MVTIMAGVHSQETLPYLRITFTYDNPKVRAETVRALGLTGGYEASMLLITGLEDPDENIRLLCTRWLGRLGEEKAVGRLVRMLEGRDPGGESLVIKKELISSLGQIKAPESYQALKRFSSRQKLTRRSEWREINQAAGEALSRLVEKYPHLEGL
jgi:HEAT repeat protein